MPVIDIILGALILYGIIKGFFKGLFVEVASLLALMLGVYGAVHFSNYAAEFLSGYVDWSEQTMNISSFAITFIVIVLAVSLAGKALTKLANFAALGLINKLLGALFGGLKITLILSVLLLVFERFNTTLSMVSKDELEDSILYQPVGAIAPMILPRFIDEKTILELPQFEDSEEQ
ncbi:CvpA family protein [Flavobacteriaceae bacterium]|nr:CvpA family protein [Flavobacteriaceae bacterium]MDB2631636.1 CvpA family protein [Flavobacteriaceae bacterium]